MRDAPKVRLASDTPAGVPGPDGGEGCGAASPDDVSAPNRSIPVHLA
jgi:hypothetical protein